MKLYWRYKKDGKWTSKPVGIATTGPNTKKYVLEEEE